MRQRFLNRAVCWLGNRRTLLTLLPCLFAASFGMKCTPAPAQTASNNNGSSVPTRNGSSVKQKPHIKFIIQMQAPVSKQGVIVAELFPEAAPKTVAHFLALVNKKFYDKVLFHRVIAGPEFYIAQAGDPKSRSVEGAKIKELSDLQVSRQYDLGRNGSGATVVLEQNLPHMRGTLGLARSSDPDSGDSQFFFNLKDNHTLDNRYCVFGKVVKGLDVMDKLQQGDRILTLRVVSSTPNSLKPKSPTKN